MHDSLAKRCFHCTTACFAAVLSNLAKLTTVVAFSLLSSHSFYTQSKRELREHCVGAAVAFE